MENAYQFTALDNIPAVHPWTHKKGVWVIRKVEKTEDSVIVDHVFVEDEKKYDQIMWDLL